jgi:ABC-type branched-subunit amino acid transport system ATPase component
MTSPTISVGALTRPYRGQLALDDVTFDVQGASITGLLGRNRVRRQRWASREYTSAMQAAGY